MMRTMMDGQLDLFSQPALTEIPVPNAVLQRRCIDVDGLTDEELVAALPGAGIVDALAIANTIGQRRLKSAVPALEALCRRYAGFGASGPAIPEQVAALEALAAIGGAPAAQVVARLILRQQVLGNTLAVALSVAVQLAVTFPPETALDLLRNPDPSVRADACRCVRSHPAVIATLVDLLSDLHGEVHAAAACALGRLGRTETRPMLLRLLDRTPDRNVVEALAAIADDDTVVLLGRWARTRSPALREAVIAALEECETPLAAKVAHGLRATQR
jgi:HEAT repeat protein